MLTGLLPQVSGQMHSSLQLVQPIADLLGCNLDEVVFGANMTTLTYTLSRAIARELQPGDEIIVTKLDHYANVSPWYALSERGVVIREVDINVEDCTLNMNHLQQQINERTRLVAVGYASNAVGTINDVATVVKLAHAVGAMVFVDAVHYVPHGPIDVHMLECDFLTCSAYKFFGPHVGVLYAKREHLDRLRPYKVQPAPEELPSRWETGTQNYEGLAGLVATINYLAQIGHRVLPGVKNRREALLAAMIAIKQYERDLCQKLVTGLLQILVSLYTASPIQPALTGGHQPLESDLLSKHLTLLPKPWVSRVSLLGTATFMRSVLPRS
jgi:cysteine desulfurase family protein (TIGR01976 family)